MVRARKTAGRKTGRKATAVVPSPWTPLARAMAIAALDSFSATAATTAIEASHCIPAIEGVCGWALTQGQLPGTTPDDCAAYAVMVAQVRVDDPRAQAWRAQLNRQPGRAAEIWREVRAVACGILAAVASERERECNKTRALSDPCGSTPRKEEA